MIQPSTFLSRARLADALFSGVVFLTAVALLLSPIFHRLLHHFHLDNESQ